MKKVLATTTHQNNSSLLTYTQIQCDGCKRVIEVKGNPGTKKVTQALERDCRTCNPVVKPTGSRGWWSAFGLEKNPYVYGPMPRLRTAVQFRIAEARQRGWVSWVWDDEYKDKRKVVDF